MRRDGEVHQRRVAKIEREIEVRECGVELGDTAIANYRFVVMVEGPNVDQRRRYRTTNVWAKRDGRWQIVAAQMGFVLDPQQAALLSGEQK